MKRSAKALAVGAVIAAMYAAVCYGQNLLLPGSASWAVQLRLAEALCVLALFTPWAAAGLGAGCFLFNLSQAGALPLDAPVGALATVISAWAMWRLRRRPWLALAMPAAVNGLLVGAELTAFMGRGFGLNFLLVFLGEVLVLYTLGAALYGGLGRGGMARRLFGEDASQKEVKNDIL